MHHPGLSPVSFTFIRWPRDKAPSGSSNPRFINNVLTLKITSMQSNGIDRFLSRRDAQLPVSMIVLSLIE